MRFNISLITAFAAVVFAAPVPEGDSSNDVGCKAFESDAKLFARCVGIETAGFDALSRRAPEGDSSNDVGCKAFESDAKLFARCVGIEVCNEDNKQLNFNGPLLSV